MQNICAQPSDAHEGVCFDLVADVNRLLLNIFLDPIFCGYNTNLCGLGIVVCIPREFCKSNGIYRLVFVVCFDVFFR